MPPHTPHLPNTKPLRACLAAGLLSATAVVPAAQAMPRVPDSTAQRALACTGCHGPQGKSSPEGYVPRIAGKPAGYLAAQLRAFRDGRRRHDGMARLLENLDDAFLRELAGHFAALDVPYAAPVPTAGLTLTADDTRRAEQLVREGDPGRRLPACAGCHGAALTGIAPQVPGLLGLPGGYLSAQLGSWRVGTRRADAPDCMAEIARRLAPGDITALSRWLERQPVPQPASPLPAGSARRTPWPMACGESIR
ncbi:c-type cytochrome [Leptothrix discophora]|uniref:C-type cytochrome n=1 Tax=Leptothrix discophora TaxID=89 RepID=A0ABT9G2G5_LEPDI|nr:c-type cytochrome [Leptothrix discophora]MDP4300679.1 c-type cytochrome [Leptothrix discophora]